jgi:MFS transporter, DHA1 family, tetracycline resistance protein
MNTNKNALATIFLIIFIDLLGFGLIIPIVPFYLETYVAHPDQIGRTIALMITIFSLMQFIFNPIWGRLSDRYGRRPILLISLTGAMISHLLFALAPSLPLLFAARILTGIFSATVPTAMAYISDVTDHDSRAKGMGLVGAAFGLGFILGPAAGGILAGIGGFKLPLFGAAVISAVALTYAFFSLKETVDVDNPVERDYRRFNLGSLLHALRHPNLGLLFLLFFIVSLAFANMETVFALYIDKVFHYTSKEAGYFFAFIGLISAVTQGLLIGKLSKRFGEKKLITAAMLIMGFSFILLPLANNVPLFVLFLGLIAFSLALNNPSVTSLVSKNASKDEQGGVLGINQSFSSLGRIIGPLWAGFAFDRFGVGIPFFSAGILLLIASAFSVRLLRKSLLESKS